MIKSPFLFAIVLAVTSACQQQKIPATEKDEVANTDSITRFISSEEIDSVLNEFPKDTARGESAGMGFMIGLGHSATQCWIVKRTSPGLVEMHEQWDDIVTIRSGKGILRTGKMVTGNRKRMDTRQSKNWMGGTIVNPEVQHIKTGDFFLIPAMTGHQYIPDENDSLVYWTLKLRRVISRTQ